MEQLQVIFAKSDGGRKYVADFIEKLDLEKINQTVHLIDLLSRYGHLIGNNYIKKIRGELYELRVPGKIQIRVLFTFDGQTVVLLHAFKKKSNRIPLKEIATAARRFDYYKLRN